MRRRSGLRIAPFAHIQVPVPKIQLGIFTDIDGDTCHHREGKIEQSFAHSLHLVLNAEIILDRVKSMISKIPAHVISIITNKIRGIRLLAGCSVPIVVGSHTTVCNASTCTDVGRNTRLNAEINIGIGKQNASLKLCTFNRIAFV